MTSQQLSFSRVDPRTYLDLAKTLASQSDAASRRSAVDRAYYAAFLFSRDELAAKVYITPYYSTEDHGYISDNLRLHVALDIGNSEERLRRARNSITYNTRVITLDLSLRAIIDMAERVIQAVATLRARNQYMRVRCGYRSLVSLKHDHSNRLRQ